MNVGKQIFSGVVWTTIQTVVNRSFGFIIKLFLARILFPEDYGLVGMATVFTSLIQVFTDLGMGAALVQRKQEKLTDLHYHTAFWTGVVWSLVIYLVIALGVAPFAAWFYEEELLLTIIPVLSIGVLASPVNLVHNAQLVKALNFKKLAIINNASSIFSGLLALCLAFLGFGVWSLVFNAVASFVIAMPLYFKATGWWPKWSWDKQCFKDIFGFGVYTTGTQLFNKLTGQIDYLLVGKLLGAASLGIYSFAFILTETFRGQMMTIVNRVMYPIYSRLQDDKEKLVHYYLRAMRFNALIVYPIMVFLLVFADFIIPWVFGNKWENSIPIIQILSVSVLIYMFINSNSSLVRGYGRPDIELKMQLIKTLFFFVPLISLGTVYFGTIGAAVGFTLAKFLAVLLSLFVTRKLLGLDIMTMIKPLAEPIIISGTSGVLAFVLVKFDVNSWLSILLYLLMVTLLTLRAVKEDIRRIREVKLAR
jgi:teichuronic acid exporter